MVGEDLTGYVIFESSPDGGERVGHAGIISGKSISGREINKRKVPKLGACLAFKKQPRRPCSRSGVNERKGNRIGHIREVTRAAGLGFYDDFHL